MEERTGAIGTEWRVRGNGIFEQRLRVQPERLVERQKTCERGAVTWAKVDFAAIRRTAIAVGETCGFQAIKRGRHGSGGKACQPGAGSRRFERDIAGGHHVITADVVEALQVGNGNARDVGERLVKEDGGGCR